MRKINYKNLGLVIAILMMVVLLALTPHFNNLVNISRGYKAIGGECLIWLLPSIYFALYIE